MEELEQTTRNRVSTLSDESSSRTTQFEELGPTFVTRYEVSAKELEALLQREKYQHDSAFVVPMINNNCFLNDEDLVRFVPIFRQEFDYESHGQGELTDCLKRLISKACLKSIVLKEVCCRAILTYNCKATMGEKMQAQKKRVAALKEKLDKSIKPTAPKTNRFSRIDKAFLFKARALRRVLERQERISSASNRQTLIDRTEELAGLTKAKKHDFLKRSRKTRLVSRPPEWYVQKKRRERAMNFRSRKSAASFLSSLSRQDLLAKVTNEPKRIMFSPEILQVLQEEEQGKERRASERDLKRAAKNPFAFSEEFWIRHGKAPCPPRKTLGSSGPAFDSTRYARKRSAGPRAVRFQSRVRTGGSQRTKVTSDSGLAKTLKANQLREAEATKTEALKQKIEDAVNERMRRFVAMLHHSSNSEMRTFKLI